MLNLITVGILRLWTTKREPVQLPDPPALLLRLDLVARELLLLLLRRCRCAPCLVFRTAAGGRAMDRRSRSLQARTRGCISAAATSRLRVCKRIFDDSCFALLRDTAGLNVPDLGACLGYRRSAREGGGHKCGGTDTMRPRTPRCVK